MRAQEASLEAARAGSYSRDHSQVLHPWYLPGYIHGRYRAAQACQLMPILPSKPRLAKTIRSRLLPSTIQLHKSATDHQIPPPTQHLHAQPTRHAIQRHTLGPRPATPLPQAFRHGPRILPRRSRALAPPRRRESSRAGNLELRRRRRQNAPHHRLLLLLLPRIDRHRQPKIRQRPRRISILLRYRNRLCERRKRVERAIEYADQRCPHPSQKGTYHITCPTLTYTPNHNTPYSSTSTSSTPSPSSTTPSSSNSSVSAPATANSTTTSTTTARRP